MRLACCCSALLASSANGFLAGVPVGSASARQANLISARPTLRMAGGEGSFASLKRNLAVGAAALLIAASPISALAADGQAPSLNAAQQVVRATTEEQAKRVRSDEQSELRQDTELDNGAVIAKVVVTLKSDTFPLGFPDTSVFPNLDTDKARLIATAFGRQGPPVAAKRLTLKGRQFPVVLELTDNDLAFPLTKDAWKKDARSTDDIGVAVVLDVDGRLTTLEGGGLTGYGVSKQVSLGGQIERTEAIVTVDVNKALEENGSKMLPEDEKIQLERVDSMLDLKEQQAAEAQGGGFGKFQVGGGGGSGKKVGRRS